MLNFRKAEESDFDILLAWRNDPVARNASRYTGIVDKERFKKDVLEARDVWIAEDETGTPIGTVNIKRRGEESELSWIVAPEARGKGIGKQMVLEAVRMVLPTLSHPLVADIRRDNIASEKIAESTGFLRRGDSETPDFIRWQHKGTV